MVYSSLYLSSHILQVNRTRKRVLWHLFPQKLLYILFLYISEKNLPLSANSIFTPTPPMQKQYGFLTVCKNREMRSFRESALSKVIPLTSGRDSAATAPMSTLLICSSSCVVNFTVNLLRRLIERLPLFGGETQQASTTGMLACCLTPPWDTLSRGLL